MQKARADHRSRMLILKLRESQLIGPCLDSGTQTAGGGGAELREDLYYSLLFCY